MSSIQDDDRDFRLGFGPGTKSESDADMSMYGDGYPSSRREGQEMEFEDEDVSEQPDPSNAEGDDNAGHRGSQSSGERFAHEARDSESFASELTVTIQGILQKTQTDMELLLNNVNEIESSSEEVREELQSAKESAMERKSKLEEDRDKVHDAVYRVLEVLNITNNMMDGIRSPH